MSQPDDTAAPAAAKKTAAKRLKPTLPPPGLVAASQEKMKDLATLDEWTEQPGRPPVSAPAASPAPTTAPAAQRPAKAPPAPPEKPKERWEGLDPTKLVPLYVRTPEPLKVMIDDVWKDKRYDSMQAYVLDILSKDVTEHLRKQGRLK